jgi:DNA polymerase-1
MGKNIKLALIDSHALIHRAYHALPPMTTKDGAPTNAVYGFVTTLLKLLTTIKPTHIVAAFDVKGPTFRSEEYADYKAQRKPADKELISQFALVRKVVAAFNIPVVFHKGFEADDIIGTLVTKVDGGIKKVIVTGDADTLQLVDDDTSVFMPKRAIADTVLYDETLVREKYGFGPEHLVDYKGLRGDPSDNIKGVAGVGDKTAKELIQMYGTIENIFAHFADLPPRLQKKLDGQEKVALQSKRLATIRRDVPVEFDVAASEFVDFNPEEVRKVFLELEFTSLIPRIPASKHGGFQPTLLQADSPAAVIEMPANYALAERPAAQKKLQEELLKEKIIAFDTETDGLGARTSPIVGMSFAVRRGQEVLAWYVPVNRQSVKAWKQLLESTDVKKVGHNIKYDMEVVRASGIELNGVVFDSMIASFLLNPAGRQNDLDTLSVQELQHTPIPITDLIGMGKQQKKMSQVPLLEVARYAAEDAELTYKLYEVFAPRLKQEKLDAAFEQLEIPLIPVLADLELAGVALDSKVLAAMHDKVALRLKDLEKKIWKAAGQEFNIKSPIQLREVLFNVLKLPTVGIARTQSGFSTAAAELDKLHGQHEIIAWLEDYRELSKLQSTYIDTLPTMVDPATGRIHTSVNQTIAATGRLSSTDPNLQNIPVRTELGQEIRRAFVAEKGNVLVKADYSQLELRIAAHMSQDEKLVDVFRSGGDVHRSTAAWVTGVKPEEVTDAQRRQAKTLNFGVLYGMGANAFARAAGISVEEARSFIGRYRDQYPGIIRLTEAILLQAKTQGYVETLFGRRRYMPEIHSNNPGIKAQAERIAFNFPIQGTEADILKKAMIELHTVMKKDFPKVRMILTVHDELVCEVSEKEADKFAAVMKKIMEGAYALDVPLIVDVAKGPNWKDVEEIKI